MRARLALECDRGVACNNGHYVEGMGDRDVNLDLGRRIQSERPSPERGTLADVEARPAFDL